MMLATGPVGCRSGTAAKRGCGIIRVTDVSHRSSLSDIRRDPILCRRVLLVQGLHY